MEDIKVPDRPPGSDASKQMPTGKIVRVDMKALTARTWGILLLYSTGDRYMVASTEGGGRPSTQVNARFLACCIAKALNIPAYDASGERINMV